MIIDIIFFFFKDTGDISLQNLMIRGGGGGGGGVLVVISSPQLKVIFISFRKITPRHVELEIETSTGLRSLRSSRS